jgi:hypothetical protein
LRYLAFCLAVSASACSLLYDVGSLGPGQADADAGDDASDASQDAPAPLPFCTTTSPAPAFCADFDQGDLKAGWRNEGLTSDPSVTAGNAILADDPAKSFDGTRAVAMDFPAKKAGGTPGQAVLIKQIDQFRAGTSIIIRMEARIDTSPPTSALGFTMVAFGFGDNGALGGFLLVRDISYDALAVAIGGAPGDIALFPSLPSNKWMNLSFEVLTKGIAGGSCAPDGGTAPPGDGGGEGGTGFSPAVNLIVDGSPVACVTLPDSFATATKATFTIGGLGATAPVEAFHVAFDNVTLYLR